MPSGNKLKRYHHGQIIPKLLFDFKDQPLADHNDEFTFAHSMKLSNRFLKVSHLLLGPMAFVTFCFQNGLHHLRELTLVFSEDGR
jgi:hypothetical protein